MSDQYEPDVEKILRAGAREGGKEVKFRHMGRELALIFAAIIAMGAGVWHVDRTYTNRVRHTIEQRMCTVIVPLLPQTPQEVPSTGYGRRVMVGVEAGAKQNHCRLSP